MYNTALICAALAAAIHYYIFYLEYPAYGSARFCRTFGVSPTELATLRVPFRNLAIYNVMQATGAYLSCTAPDKRCAACIQAIPPLLAFFGLFLS